MKSVQIAQDSKTLLCIHIRVATQPGNIHYTDTYRLYIGFADVLAEPLF